MTKLILASRSTYRQEILRQAGIDFECFPVDIDEDVWVGPSPDETARLRARAKARAASQLWDCCDVVILGCDQVLDFQGETFGKAHSREEAFDRIKMLAGQQHYLHSAVTLIRPRQAHDPHKEPTIVFETVETATMQMKELSERDINSYLDLNEWQGICGCYQFENQGSRLFEQVIGSPETIIGLPLQVLLEPLKNLGISNTSPCR